MRQTGLVISVLTITFLQACSGAEPVATQYKNANSSDAEGSSPPPPGDPSVPGEPAAPAGDPDAGLAFFSQSACTGCHAEGGSPGPIQARDEGGFSIAKDLPIHSGFAATWPSGADLENLLAWLQTQ